MEYVNLFINGGRKMRHAHIDSKAIDTMVNTVRQASEVVGYSRGYHKGYNLGVGIGLIGGASIAVVVNETIKDCKRKKAYERLMKEAEKIKKDMEEKES